MCYISRCENYSRLLIVLDLANLILLVYGSWLSIKAGGGTVMFPGLGIVVAMPLLLAAVFIIELMLVSATFLLYRQIKNSSVGLM